jgi:GNAT superfamily N-acetyltransferase
LFQRETGGLADASIIARAIAGGLPGVVVFDEAELRGFAYTRQFGPDVLELYRILVASPVRGKGLGTLLLDRLETVSEELGWKAMVVLDSQLHPRRAPVSTSARLYEHAGYDCYLDTGPTQLWGKQLNPLAVPAGTTSF